MNLEEKMDALQALMKVLICTWKKKTFPEKKMEKLINTYILYKSLDYVHHPKKNEKKNFKTKLKQLTMAFRLWTQNSAAFVA